MSSPLIESAWRRVLCALVGEPARVKQNSKSQYPPYTRF